MSIDHFILYSVVAFIWWVEGFGFNSYFAVVVGSFFLCVSMGLILKRGFQ